MSRIYKRNNLIEGVVPKKNNEHARKRNVIINNRVTPGDRDIIYTSTFHKSYTKFYLPLAGQYI